ncbi:MBL fold metallo-hydrolase [Tissierella sp. P1]|uniref:MBL fold metallo-hydrolase n=1 Tax=Tissierella sp. P1 TaxID=1280483 RepID=UPI000BA112CC|nr:MBL fold metallo-hydrolase [Tissierella sp. P1]OZV12295.1 MBL fold metallo-hydrolase [Tissierella sp. P1]
MKLKVLASGSKGNCYILETLAGTLILECGISWKEILLGLNYDISRVIGCLVSHEHKDHSRAIEDVMNAGIDVWTSQGTIEALGIKHYRLKPIKDKDRLLMGDMTILPFEVQHDAKEPLGFLIRNRPTGENLLFITDSYYSKYKFKDLKYIMVECNYIKETLDENIENGYIDQAMKPRLLQSHFSLENVKEFLKTNDLSQCREIVLLHLSDRNSDSEQMMREIREVTGITPKVATRGLEVELNLYPY